jgi:aminopeptidase N
VHSKECVLYEDTVAVSLDGNGGDVAVVGFGYDAARDFFVVHLGETLEAGVNFSLSVEFTGELNDDLSGFYRSSYVAADSTRRWLATTQFQATDARKAFPCLDEPALKATFAISMARPEAYKSVRSVINAA